jgi:hypothetical protein
LQGEIVELRRDGELEAKRFGVDKKNLLSQFIIERDAWNAEIEVVKKAARMHEDKAKHWFTESHKKDEFIKNYMISRTQTQ